MATSKVNLPISVNSALVVCPRRIGDVLFATPVVRSLKNAYSSAAIDMLVFEGTEGVVSANPDVRRVLTISPRPGLKEHVSLYKAIWGRYDLAVSVQASDRSTLYAWASAKVSVGIVVKEPNAWWKRQLLTDWVPLDNLTTHTVSMNLRPLDLLGVMPIATPVIGWSKTDEEMVRSVFPASGEQEGYVVLHVSPKFSYKQWTVSGWVELAQWLASQALKIVVVAGDSEEDQAYVSNLIPNIPSDSISLAGKISLPALGCLLSRAALYIGTDTAVTHMAAALGTPTVALFGPSNPIKWGPWPKEWPASAQSPWKFKGSQRQGNVILLQGEGDCVPCLHEGCDRHINSLSDCLQHLQAGRVVAAAEQLLHSERSLTPSVY
jgi:heptosyltransferase III